MIYRASNAEEASSKLEAFAKKVGWGVSHHQPNVAPELGTCDTFFCIPGRDIRRVIYTTNAIRSR